MLNSLFNIFLCILENVSGLMFKYDAMYFDFTLLIIPGFSLRKFRIFS